MDVYKNGRCCCCHKLIAECDCSIMHCSICKQCSVCCKCVLDTKIEISNYAKALIFVEHFLEEFSLRSMRANTFTRMPIGPTSEELELKNAATDFLKNPEVKRMLSGTKKKLGRIRIKDL